MTELKGLVRRMKFTFITNKDIETCIEFVEIVKDDFAGYKEEEFKKALESCIKNKEALAAMDDSGKIACLLLFSKTEKELQFIATHPDYRKQGAAKILIQKMMLAFQPGDQIQVVTFTAGDNKGIAARNCYHSCGFVDDELLTVFDYPCQKMILTIE